jgi:hypothetical protein
MSLQIQIQIPEMTPERYAEHSGLTEDSVKSMLHRNQLPRVKAGRRVMVNVVQRIIDLSSDSEG